jgi:hypothetical protein
VSSLTYLGIPLNKKGEFTATDTFFDGVILKNPWLGLQGTPNGRAVNFMLQDHPKEFKGLKVVKIHTWPHLNGDPNRGAMIFELGK